MTINPGFESDTWCEMLWLTIPILNFLLENENFLLENENLPMFAQKLLLYSLNS